MRAYYSRTAGTCDQPFLTAMRELQLRLIEFHPLEISMHSGGAYCQAKVNLSDVVFVGSVSRTVTPAIGRGCYTEIYVSLNNGKKVFLMFEFKGRMFVREIVLKDLVMVDPDNWAVGHARLECSDPSQYSREMNGSPFLEQVKRLIPPQESIPSSELKDCSTVIDPRCYRQNELLLLLM